MLDIVYLFCVYSFLGWVVEILFFYCKTQKWHKRGILGGPYCPLYGFSLIVCTLLLQFTNNILLSLLICGTVCTLFELITAIIFDKVFKTPMWDYSECKVNYKGYICLEFSIIWSITALMCVKILNPLILSTFSVLKNLLCVVILTMMSMNIVIKAKQ